jgi:hypothetical protein
LKSPHKPIKCFFEPNSAISLNPSHATIQPFQRLFIMRSFLLLVFLIPLCGWTQINFQLGQAMTVGNKNAEYEIAYENYVGTYYSDFRKIGSETFFKVSSYNPWDTSKFSVKYTLEFGLSYFNYYGYSFHEPNVDYWEPGQFDVGASNFYMRSVSWTNGADFIFRINRKLTFISTLGFKVAAINAGYEEKHWGSGRRLHTWNLIQNKQPLTNPLITVSVAPQLLINFKGWSLGLHLKQDVLVLNSLLNNMKGANVNAGKVQLSPFTSLGVSFMPNFYLVKADDLLGE